MPASETSQMTDGPRAPSQDEALSPKPVVGDPVADETIADAALDWFLRSRDEPENPVLCAELAAWRQLDPRHEAEFQAIRALWGDDLLREAVSHLPANPPGEFAPRPSWSRPHWRRYPVGLAAGVAAALIGAWGIWQAPDLMIDWRADHLTRRGQEARLALPDGSQMILNTDSAVSVDFADGKRNVALLRGEAFFQVKPDPAHPFRVSGGFGTAEVKGTSFAVRREADRDAILLEEGQLAVTCLCDLPQQVLMHAGEEITVDAQGPGATHAADVAQRLAWRDGRLVFEEATFGQVVDELARYHAGRILIARAGLRDQPVAGSYQLDDTDGALGSLAAASGAVLTRLPGGIILIR